MQVVFLQNVKGVGRKGEVKNVAEGYYFNFLLPKKIAVMATPGKLQEAAKMRESEVLQKGRIAEEAKAIKAKLQDAKLVIKSKANGDKLYGSIGEKDIIDLIAKEFNVKLDKSHLKLSEHIKVAGVYEIPLHLAEGIEAKITLTIKGEK